MQLLTKVVNLKRTLILALLTALTLYAADASKPKVRALPMRRA